mmetsp:Transcript_5016/g.20584  ORF Transcript_5016/g.20584 Transcript_5016/m.20584 type:complete len:232 (+) Transcript_5016:1212-1907(+)
MRQRGCTTAAVDVSSSCGSSGRSSCCRCVAKTPRYLGVYQKNTDDGGVGSQGRPRGVRMRVYPRSPNSARSAAPMAAASVADVPRPSSSTRTRLRAVHSRSSSATSSISRAKDDLPRAGASPRPAARRKTASKGGTTERASSGAWSPTSRCVHGGDARTPSRWREASGHRSYWGGVQCRGDQNDDVFFSETTPTNSAGDRGSRGDLGMMMMMMMMAPPPSTGSSLSKKSTD